MTATTPTDRTRTGSGEELAYDYARQSQGYTGTFAEWLDLPDDERAEYEDGAQGIGTV